MTCIPWPFLPALDVVRGPRLAALRLFGARPAEK
jgi:hypothetical protein